MNKFIYWKFIKLELKEKLFKEKYPLSDKGYLSEMIKQGYSLPRKQKGDK